MTDLVKHNKSVNDRVAEKNRGEISSRLGEEFVTESTFDEVVKRLSGIKKGKKLDLSHPDIKTVLRLVPIHGSDIDFVFGSL